MHIGVDILVNKLPNTMRNIVRILVDLILLFTNGYLFYLSVVFVRLSYIKPTAVLGVSSAWVSSALIVGFCLTTIYSVGHMANDIKRIVKTGTFGKGEE